MASVDITMTTKDVGHLSVTEDDKFTFEDNTHNAQLTQRMVNMRKEDVLTDITLRAGSSEVRCHKVTLAAASEYFHHLITSEQVSDLIQLQTMSQTCLEALVDFIYTSRLEISAECIKEVATSCDQLQLSSLKEAADRFIAEKAEPANSIGLLMLGKKHNLELTTRRAMEVLKEKVAEVGEVALDQEFKALGEEAFVEWISCDDLEVEEERFVLNLVERWVQADTARGTEACIARDLAHVRLALCPAHYLINTVNKSPLFQFPLCQKLIQEAIQYGYLLMAGVNTQGLENERTRPRNSDPGKNRSLLKSAESSKVVIIGGDDTSGTGNAQCWELSQDGGTQWTELAQLPPAKVQHSYGTAACRVSDGFIITGGHKAAIHSNQAWLFSMTTKEWAPLPLMKQPRAYHGVVSDGKHVYVFGGRCGKQVLATVERLDEDQQNWSYMAVQPRPTHHNQGFFIDGSIFVVSGKERKTMQYNIQSNSWLTKMPKPYQNYCAAMTCVDKSIYVIGDPDSSCLKYDTICDTWTELASPSQLRYNASAVPYLSKVLICGGTTTGGFSGSLDSIEEYEPGTDTWSISKLKMPKPLYYHHTLAL